MGVPTGKGAEVCVSTSWRLIIIPAEANVRVVGTEVCMIGVRVATRTSREWKKGKRVVPDQLKAAAAEDLLMLPLMY